MALTRKAPLNRGTSQLRRTGLQRCKPLKPGMVKLSQGKPLQRQPMKRARPKPAVAPVVRAGLKERSGGVCEIRVPGLCSGRGFDAAHRVGQGVGGGDDLSNVVYACRMCHQWCHDHRRLAEQLGLILPSTAVPLAEPVTYRGRRVLLDNHGGVHNLPANYSQKAGEL